jgi:thiol-disulfide isomerase/thioredoxin
MFQFFHMKTTAVLLTIAFLYGCYGRKPEQTGMEGKSMPSFPLLLPDSTTQINTNSIKPGKPTVLFCFGPYCPYSRAQMEEIIEDMHKMKDIRFYIFTNWPFKDMKGFYKHYELYKYSNITTGLDYTDYFRHYFEARGVPYIAIYGKDNRLKKSFIGEIYSSQIKEVAAE